jgi:hypothetical protein
MRGVLLAGQTTIVRFKYRHHSVGHYQIPVKFTQQTRTLSHQSISQTTIVLRGRTSMDPEVIPYPPKQKFDSVKLGEDNLPIQRTCLINKSNTPKNYIVELDFTEVYHVCFNARLKAMF